MALPAPLRTAIHVVAGYYVDADIPGRSETFRPLSSRKAHRGLAAAVVKEVDVGAAEMAVRDAVEDAVHAGFADAQPGEIVEQPQQGITNSYSCRPSQFRNFVERVAQRISIKLLTSYCTQNCTEKSSMTTVQVVI